jgi:hypothetical protein
MSDHGATGGAGAPLPTISAEDLLGKVTTVSKWIDVPEWSARVKVRELSMGEYHDVQKRSTNPHGDIDEVALQCNLVCAGMVEPDLGPDAYEWVKGQSMRAVSRVLEAVIDLSALGADAIGEAEATFPEAPGDDVEVPPSA